MSPRARRLVGEVDTTRFHWQGGAPRAAFQPAPVLFMQSVRGSGGGGDVPLDIEARELHLPAVASERIEAIEREAYARGYAQGERAAEAEAAIALAASLERLALTVNAIAALRPSIMRQTEHEVVRLAIAMAERIVRRQISLDPDLLLVITRVVIDRLGEQVTTTVHLNPLDVAATSGRRDHGCTFEVISDSAVARGGCLIKSTAGVIDAGVSAQIAELTRELLGGDSGEEALSGVIAGA